MSDTSQGPGWWQASDGKWYPPEQAPAPQAGGGGTAPGGVPASAVDLGAAFTYGWRKFVQYLGQIIIILLIIVGVNIAFQLISGLVSSGQGVGSVIISLFMTVLGLFISFLLAAGVIRAALAVTRGEEPNPSMLFETTNLAPYIVASILVSIGIFIGFFLLCIGALIVALFTYFYGFYVIDRGDDAVASIRNSIDIVKNNLGSVLGFVILAVVLNVVTCGLAYGVTYIAGAYVYRTLNGESVAA